MLLSCMLGHSNFSCLLSVYCLCRRHFSQNVAQLHADAQRYVVQAVMPICCTPYWFYDGFKLYGYVTLGRLSVECC